MPQQVHQIDRYCSDCDIRFSSTKTYRAHKMHYCSTRHRDGYVTFYQIFFLILLSCVHIEHLQVVCVSKRDRERYRKREINKHFRIFTIFCLFVRICSALPTAAAAPTVAKPVKGTESSQSPIEMPKSPPIIPPQPYLALPTTPIVIIPYSLIRLANVLPGPL
jgi:zinc finger protein ZFPM1